MRGKVVGVPYMSSLLLNELAYDMKFAVPALDEGEGEYSRLFDVAIQDFRSPLQQGTRWATTSGILQDTVTLLSYTKCSLPLLNHIMNARTNPLMPTQPRMLHCVKVLPAAPPLEGAVEDVELVVDDVDVLDAVELEPGVEVVLDVEVELPVASMNTPPAMAGGATVLVFLAAIL